jgi:hypothetical protein
MTTPKATPVPRSDREPELSVVLITPASFESIRQTVRCLARQSIRDRIELVIVAPIDARIEADPELCGVFANVRIVTLSSVSPTGPARAAAVRSARAPVVAFAEDHCFPAPTWADALVRAHLGPYAAVGPAIRNANPDTMVSWADLLIAYGPWMNPAAPREMDFLPGHNSAYKRLLLLDYGDSLSDLMEAETVLQWDLRRKGHRLLLEPAAQAAHTNFGLWSSWIPVMYFSGRAFAATRSSGWSPLRRLVFTVSSPLIPFVRFARVVVNARRARPSWPFLLRVLPTIAVGLVIDGAGQASGYAAGAGTAHQRMARYEWHRLQHTPRGRTEHAGDGEPLAVAPSTPPG